MCVYDLIHGDVDDWLAERHHVGVLVHVKLLLGDGHVTGSLEESPESKQQYSAVYD